MTNRGDTWDLVVVGAGSGGLGAALAGARLGLRVLVLERRPAIGGNAVHGGVHVWEPGVGGTGLPFEIYRGLRRFPQGVGIYSFGRHCCWPASNRPWFPGGELLIDPRRRYRDTLRRHGTRGLRDDEAAVRRDWHGVVFEPAAYLAVVEAMLRETGRVEVRTGVTATEVDCRDGRLLSARAGGRERIRARIWIDGTDTAALSRACGVSPLVRGDAPRNGVSLIYRVGPTTGTTGARVSREEPARCWWQSSFPYLSCAEYPNGDRNCNMLPTMSGDECAALGAEAAYVECERRVRAHWRWLQEECPEFGGHGLVWIAPSLGRRETVHQDCEYLLTEEDVRQGITNQGHPDVIALADHPVDRHGVAGAGGGELAQPYGIPFRCLVPKGLRNVLVASMAAGFTPAAAASCRLSRTMMQLGQAAGTAAAIALRLTVGVGEVPPSDLRRALRAQHVQLDWPPSGDLEQYLADEDA